MGSSHIYLFLLQNLLKQKHLQKRPQHCIWFTYHPSGGKRAANTILLEDGEAEGGGTVWGILSTLILIVSYFGHPEG